MKKVLSAFLCAAIAQVSWSLQSSHYSAGVDAYSAIADFNVTNDRCDDWKPFKAAGSVLTSTQVVAQPSQSPKSFDEFDHGSWWQGLFVDPPSRFAFCTIEKNACESWLKVLTKMYLKTGQTLTNKLSQAAATYWGRDGLEKVFRDKGATRAVIIREPLARFASVYLDKCVTPSHHGFCWPNQKDNVTIPFSEAVEWYLKQDDHPDGHWKMQSKHCELHKRINEYTVIGYMTKDNLNRDSQCIMKQAGLESFLAGSNFLKGINNDTQGNKVGHYHSSSNLDEEEILKKLYTKEAARKLISHFKLDYETFNLPPEPSWVAEATGEWYDITPPLDKPSLAQTDSSSSTGPMLHSGDEEDDIVVSALKAGYVNF